MARDLLVPVPYCGTAPVPGELWGNWNLDPVLLACLLALAAVYGAGLRRLRRSSPAIIQGRTEPAAFYGGWLVLTLALVSPLCSLSVALFAARVGQHMLLALVAVPLLVLGRPFEVIGALRARAGEAAAVRRRGALQQALTSAAVAWALFALFLWLWLLPGPYAATFRSDVVYWLMHLTVIASAWLLWRIVLPGRGAVPVMQRLLVGFTTFLHMGLLGALITFAPRVLYEPHVLTTWVWGLSPLDDQQLGGLIMWVPAGSVFMLAGLAALAAVLQPAPERGGTVQR